MEKNQIEPGKAISRRSFLKMAAAGTGAVALTALTSGCNIGGAQNVVTDPPEQAPPNVQPDPTPPAGEGPRAEATSLNPQDYSIRDTDSNFNTLFSPITIGTHTFSHRMIKSAAGSGTHGPGAGPDFLLGDEMLNYYLNMAKGGVELIWVEPLAAFIASVPLPDREEGEYAQFAPMTEHNEQFFRTLVEECGRYGCKLGMQLAISGMAISGLGDNSLASVSVDTIQNAHHAQMVEHARRLKDLGFVGMEINAAGFNMGRFFLTRFSNNRDDEYSAESFENRARWVTEGIEKVREECGDDFIIQVLMNCIEEQDLLTNLAGTHQGWMASATMATGPRNEVMTVEEGVEMAKLFEAAGCNSMHLRMAPMDLHTAGCWDLYYILYGIEGANAQGWQWDFNRHWQGMIRGNTGGAGLTLDVAKFYKDRLNIPVGTVTFLDPAATPAYIEEALANGYVDFLLMKRPFDVDPEYVNKLREGRRDEIVPCSRCVHCHAAGGNINLTTWYCRTNAMLQRVYRPIHIENRGHPISYELPPIDRVKDVMVVGGGAAGMEAARIAAERGHNVTLYEKSNRLGGLMHFAELVKGPHEDIGRHIKWLSRQLELKGVEVVLGQEVDTAFVNAQSPDALIVATGGLYDTLNVSNDGSVPVVPYEGFMATNMGDTVLIWGGGVLAWDAALWLIVRGKKVLIATDRPIAQLLEEQSGHARRFMTSALYAKGLRVYHQSRIRQLADGTAFVMSDINNVEHTIKCDTVLDASDMLPNRALANGVNVSEVYVIGDADKPFNIAYAVHHGNDIGRTV